MTDSIIANKQLSDLEIAVYTALRMFYNKNKELYHVNGANIYYYLSNGICTSPFVIETLNKAILDLESHGYLLITQNYNNEDFQVNLSRFNISNTKDNYYTVVSDGEIHKIVNSGEKYRYKILRYFLYLTTTFLCSSKDKYLSPISYKPATLLADATNVKNIKTIYKYNDVLQKLELIYVYKAGDFTNIKTDTVLGGIPNTYGRFKDKDIVIEEGNKYVESHGVKAKELADIKSAKSTRSASQKFNTWLNGKKEYSYDELELIYLTLVEYNNKYQGIDSLKNKDLTVFKDYDFYIEPDMKNELDQIKENWDTDIYGDSSDLY